MNQKLKKVLKQGVPNTMTSEIYYALNVETDFLLLNGTEKICFVLCVPELAYLSGKAMFEILPR